MTKRLLATGLLATLMALAPALPASAAPPPPRIVAIVLAPFLTWGDVQSGSMPHLRELTDAGAVGDMNVTSLVSGVGTPTAENGALMISAGAWTRYDAAAAAARETSATPAIVYPGFPAQVAAQRRTDVDARPGSLGKAVAEAGGVAVAIGNADLGPSLSAEPSRTSPAVLAAMDASGSVWGGSIGPALLRPVGSPAPFGVLADADAIAGALRASLAQGAAHGGPTLVVIDPGDLERAEVAGPPPAAGTDPLNRAEALRNLDTVIGDVRSAIASDALLIVAAPVAMERRDTPSGFGPVVVIGPGRKGMLLSPSTHRPGIVTAPDLSATVLDALGVPRPPEMMGEPLGADGVAGGRGRTDLLAQMDATARSVDAARPGVVNGFIALTIAAIAFGIVLLGVRRPPALAVRVAETGLLLVLSVPAANVLMFLPVRYPATPTTAVALLAGTTAFVWVLSVATHHSAAQTRGIAFIGMLIAAVILIDQWFGAPLSFSAFLGYSPIVGARFYGLGNEGAALLVGGAIVGVAMLFDNNARSSWVVPARRWGFPLVAATCILTAAAPFLGANVGVAIWGTFAFVLAWARLSGGRIGWRSMLVAALIVIVLVGAFVAFDTLSPRASRTHLGRTVVAAGRGGAVGDMVARKVAMNVGILTGSPWSWLFIVSVAVLAWLAFRPRGTFRDLLVENPAFAAALSAVSLAGLVAFFTEDSGIVVPALLLLAPVVGAVYLMLADRAAGMQR